MSSPANSNLDPTAVIVALASQLEAMGNVVERLQAQVNELTSRLPTPSPSNHQNATSMPEFEPEFANPTPTSPTCTTKSEKFPDPPMFDGNRKDLRPFVTKLRLKLRENADRYPTEANKVRYGMSRLEGDAARTMDPFYRNGTFDSLEKLIALLERTYDNACREHTAATKLENLRQANREVTSFYSRFLG